MRIHLSGTISTHFSSSHCRRREKPKEQRHMRPERMRGMRGRPRRGARVAQEDHDTSGRPERCEAISPPPPWIRRESWGAAAGRAAPRPAGRAAAQLAVGRAAAWPVGELRGEGGVSERGTIGGASCGAAGAVARGEWPVSVRRVRAEQASMWVDDDGERADGVLVTVGGRRGKW